MQSGCGSNVEQARLGKVGGPDRRPWGEGQASIDQSFARMAAGLERSQTGRRAGSDNERGYFEPLCLRVVVVRRCDVCPLFGRLALIGLRRLKTTDVAAS